MSKTHTAPTLDDVAREAGVSTATVSRCINMPDRVVEATRRKVDAAIKLLGYTPNFAARVMAAKRSRTIGAIIPTMENAIFARGLQAFQETLHKQGYTLLVASSAYKQDIEEEQIRALIARSADGLLLIGQDRPAHVYDYLKQQTIPVLTAWSYFQDSTLPCVGFDNQKAMYDLAHTAIQRGHRNIGMISGFCDGNDRAQSRVLGLKLAVKKSGLDESNIQILEGPYSIETGAASFATLMNAPTRPTVVLCGNDVLAVGAVQQAKRMGLSIPDDVAITGFDDMELAQIISPTLTTVRVPHRAMGETAALTLINMVEQKETGQSKQLQTKILFRESMPQ